MILSDATIIIKQMYCFFFILFKLENKANPERFISDLSNYYLLILFAD